MKMGNNRLAPGPLAHREWGGGREAGGRRPEPAGIQSRLGEFERLAANRAVARAKRVRLQSVEQAQGVLRVMANVQVGDADVLDDIVRINDAGRATGNAGAFFPHAEAVNERTVGVGKLPDRQFTQVGMSPAQGARIRQSRPGKRR